VVKSTLVSTDISTGSEILDILDRANVRIDVALWAILPEYEDWRLVLSSRQLDSSARAGPDRLINDTLDAAGFPLRRTPVILVLPMTDPFIRHLRRVSGKAGNAEGRRLGGQMIGNRFLEDGPARLSTFAARCARRAHGNPISGADRLADWLVKRRPRPHRRGRITATSSRRKSRSSVSTEEPSSFARA
jgi:hypothetical protein